MLSVVAILTYNLAGGGSGLQETKNLTMTSNSEGVTEGSNYFENICYNVNNMRTPTKCQINLVYNDGSPKSITLWTFNFINQY